MISRRLIPALPIAALVIAGLSAPVASAHSTDAIRSHRVATAAGTTDTLAPRQQLQPGQRLQDNDQVVSPNRLYTLYQQTGGNLVLLKGTRVLWSAGDGDHSGAQTVMQDDGNLVTAWGSYALFASNTGGNPGAYVAVQNDGNVVIYHGSTPLWATNTAGD